MSDSDDDYENLLADDGEKGAAASKVSDGKNYESLCYFYESSSSEDSDGVEEESFDDENILKLSNDSEDDSLLLIYQ